jgi:hypothetical protein
VYRGSTLRIIASREENDHRCVDACNRIVMTAKGFVAKRMTLFLVGESAIAIWIKRLNGKD